MNKVSLRKRSLRFIVIFLSILQVIAFLPLDKIVKADSLPDLIVESLKMLPEKPKPGEKVTVSAVIKNIGAPIDAGSGFTVGWDFGDQKWLWSDPITDKIDTNQTLTVLCNHGAAGVEDGKWTATSGKHTLNCMVDNYDAKDPVNARIKESNEKNNSMQLDFNVDGLQIVRIKSTWDKSGYGYLYQDKDEVKYGNVPVDDGTSQWIITDKGSYSVIQNRATGDYLNIKDNKGYIESTFIDPDKSASAKWILKAEGSGTSIKNLGNNHYAEIEELKGMARYDNKNVQGSWTSADWALDSIDTTKNFTAPLPDLVVSDINWSPKLISSGQQVLFNITVKNQGAGAMPAGDMPAAGVNVDGHAPYYYTDPIPHQLASGESCVLTVAGCSSSSALPKEWTSEAGRHTVFATVDDWAGSDPVSAVRAAHHLVVESNEDNNSYHKRLPLLKQGTTPKPASAKMAGAVYVGSDPNSLNDSEVKDVINSFDNIKNTDKPSEATVESLVKYPITQVVVGKANSKNTKQSKFGVYWDDKNLYVLTKVQDAAKFKADPKQLWNSDDVEVYLDAADSKDTGGFVDGDYQYMFGYSCDTPQESKKNAVKDVAEKQIDFDNGYAILSTIPWSTLGKVPKLNNYIGLDVAVDDNYNGSGRDSQTIWNSKDDSAWKYPSRFGDCQLVNDTKEPKPLPPVVPFDSSFKLAAKNYDVPSLRGADVPWTEYEAENAITNGTIVGPSAVMYDEASEASGRKFVELSKTGDYVTFKALKNANSIVVRYSIPDALTGGGIDAPIGVYVNGVKKRDLMLTSKYSWNYGSFPWSNDPNLGGAHHYFDEAHALIGSFKAGDKITLKVDGNKKADYYDIDFIDTENVAAPLTQPADYISITQYGADPTGKKDSTEAIYKTIQAAKTQGKGVWIPVGNFKRSSGPKVDNVYKNASGNAYVTGFDTIGATAKIEPQNIPEAKDYTSIIHYSNGTGKTQTLSLYVNGKFSSKLSFEPTANWNTWQDKKVDFNLKTGGNGIEFIQNDLDTGNIALDYVNVAGSKYEMEVGNGHDRAYLTCPLYINNVSIKGAGMWYSAIEGYYNQIQFTGNNCSLSDFAIFGETDSRTDELNDNALSGNAGKGSSINNMWIEHTKCGFWVGETNFGTINSDNNYGRTDGLIVSNCRIRNTMADGINLCDGTENSIVRNCTTRNTGDDSFAIWPAYYNQNKWSCDGNIIENCTAQLPWLAQGIALYGGADNKAINNLIMDCPTSAGILISSTFTPCASFSGVTLVQHNSIIRCGEYSQLYGGLRVMIDKLDIKGLQVDDIDIYNSVDSGIRFMDGGQGKNLSDSVFSNINITNCITNGIYISGDVKGTAEFKNIKINNTGLQATKNDSKNFIMK